MRTRFLAAALAACIPATLVAQRTRGASEDPSPMGGAPASPGARTPSSGDLADLNPATLLIHRRKKASLADSTVAALKSVEKVITERNATFFVTYDSVRKWTRSIADGGSASQGLGLRGGVGDSKLAAPVSSPAEQAKMQSSMRDLRVLMAEFRVRHKADAAEALGAVPEAQQKAATDLLAQQNADLDRLLGGRP